MSHTVPRIHVSRVSSLDRNDLDRGNLGLEHATIRDNVIFGSTYGYDESRYQAVIDACALSKDLETFDAGDMTGVFRFQDGDVHHVHRCVL